MKKRVLAVILGAVMTMSLAACGKILRTEERKNEYRKKSRIYS